MFNIQKYKIMSQYTYRVFESCGNGFSREVIFPDGKRCFNSLGAARSAARHFRRGSEILRYHCFRGLEDISFSV